MGLAEKTVVEQKHLKEWVRKKWLLLLVISLSCFLVLALFSWLAGATSYGRRHLSFQSNSLDLLFDLSYKNKTVFFSLPQENISLKIPYWKLARFGKKYWLYLKITILNLLFLIFVLLIRRIIKNRRRLISRFKDFREQPGSVGLLFISKIIIVVACLLSIFPTPHFNFWWKRFAFVSSPPKHSGITLALYEFMRIMLIDKGNRFFYAVLFTLPRFIVKWIGVSSFLLLVSGQIKLPGAWSALTNRYLDKLSNLDYKKWLPGASLWVFVLANLISLIKYQRLPAYIEDTAQFFQARLFAVGRLAESINFSREFFEFPLLNMGTQWYSTLAPGQSFLLALGHKAGAAWLINPLFGLLAVVVLYSLANRIYGRSTALLSIMFMVLSPLYLTLSASYLNHLSFIFFMLSALLLFHYSLLKQGLGYPILSGLCWGLALMIRPSSAIVMALPFGVYSIKQTLSRRSSFGFKWKHLLVFMGLALCLLLLLTYNQLLQVDQGGITPGYWLTRGLQNPSRGLFYLMTNLFTLNEQLWGFIIPGLFLVMLWILSSHQLEPWDYMLLWSIICLLIFNFLAYDIRPGLANPLMVTIPFWALLTARAVMKLPAVLVDFGFSAQDIKSVLALGISVCCISLLSLRVAPLLHSNDTYRLNIASLIEEKRINNAIIFLEREPFWQTFAYNQPDLNNDIIFARHLKGYNYKLIREFPARSYYFYDAGENKLVSINPRESP